jgi:hypothetical protein
LLELARIARRNGFVPISARLPIASAAVCSGRAFLIDDDGSSWRCGLLEAATGSPRRRVVFTSCEDALRTRAPIGSAGSGNVGGGDPAGMLAFDGRARRAADAAACLGGSRGNS